MLLIPAIDIKNGECVRLRQGRMDDATVFSTDPVAMARHWADLGARRLHLVDLDGAFAGKPKNRELVERIVAAIPQVPVQVGGGIRDMRTVESYLAAGLSSVIVGTRAVEEPTFLAELANEFPGKVFLGLDARDGRIATDGWDNTSTVDAVGFACECARLALAGIVYTDIERDGMMTGVNVAATLRLAEACGIPVIASGGVTNQQDLRALVDAFAGSSASLFGAITGRAIYEGTLDIKEGQALLDAAST